MEIWEGKCTEKFTTAELGYLLRSCNNYCIRSLPPCRRKPLQILPARRDPRYPGTGTSTRTRRLDFTKALNPTFTKSVSGVKNALQHPTDAKIKDFTNGRVSYPGTADSF
eukprot:2280924-Rhodomonas_salina.2